MVTRDYITFFLALSLLNIQLAVSRAVTNSADRGLILTSYFINQPDPQAQVSGHQIYDHNQKTYSQAFLHTVKRLSLRVVVVHDGLEDDFIAAHSDDRITFIKTDVVSPFSTNDFRYLAYSAILREKGSDLLDEVDYILMADIADVIVHHDPFEIMSSPRWRLTDLFCSLEAGIVQDNEAFGRGVRRCRIDVSHTLTRPVYNGGVWGGKVDAVRTAHCSVLSGSQIDDETVFSPVEQLQHSHI